MMLQLMLMVEELQDKLAIRLAISRALVEINEEYKPLFISEG